MLIILALVLIPIIAYGSNIGIRIFSLYNRISVDIDDFEPMDPDDIEVEEVEGEEKPTDQVQKIKFIDDAIYEIRSPRDKNKLNILLIGTDKIGNKGGQRADTIMVVQFDKTTKKSAILSLPRDTFVRIPGRGYDKINHSYAFGGPRLLKETVEGFLDIYIDHYAQVGMDGFGAIIDSLGGITVNVGHDMIDTRNGKVHFTKGVHAMNGEDALAYVRARHLTVGGSDFGRIKRQQQVMVTIFTQVKNSFSLNRTLNMLEAISPYLRTDITPGTVIGNWSSFNNADPRTIQLETLKGEGFIFNRVYYYRVPIQDARDAIAKLTS